MKARWQASKICFTQGFGKFMGAAFINVAVIENIFRGKARCICLADIGALGDIPTKTGVDQNLPGNFRPAEIACLQGQCGRKIASGAIPADNDFAKLPGKVLQNGPGIVKSRRERMFGGQAVIHANNSNIRARR